MGILLKNCCNAKLIVILTFQDVNSEHICSHYVGSAIGWSVTRFRLTLEREICSATAEESIVTNHRFVGGLEIPCIYVRTMLVATIGWSVTRSSLPQSAKADSSLIRGSRLICSLYITVNSLCNSRKTH